MSNIQRIKKNSPEAIRIGKNIKILRKSKKMKLQEFADEIGVRNYRTPNQWESGRQPPSHDHLVAIADLFEISLETLLKETITSRMLEEQLTISWNTIDVLSSDFKVVRFSSPDSMENLDFVRGGELFARALKADANISMLKASRNRYYTAFKHANLLTAAVNTIAVLLYEYAHSCLPIDKVGTMSVKEYQRYVYSETYLTEMKKHRDYFFKDTDDLIYECLYALKNSKNKKMRDVGEYYFGLICILGMVPADTPQELYRIAQAGGVLIGMASAFGNSYAEKFCKMVENVPYEVLSYFANSIEKNLYSIE